MNQLLSLQQFDVHNPDKRVIPHSFYTGIKHLPQKIKTPELADLQRILYDIISGEGGFAAVNVHLCTMNMK